MNADGSDKVRLTTVGVAFESEWQPLPDGD